MNIHFQLFSFSPRFAFGVNKHDFSYKSFKVLKIYLPVHSGCGGCDSLVDDTQLELVVRKHLTQILFRHLQTFKRLLLFHRTFNNRFKVLEIIAGHGPIFMNEIK